MLNITDTSAVETIRRYFDEMDFAYMSYRIIPEHDTKIFPEFVALHQAIKPLYPIYRLLFTLFREGHPADGIVLRQALPANVFEAMVTTGLLTQNARKQWRTPGLAIVPVDSLYLAVSIPPNYPTASTPKQPVYLGVESIWLTRALPASLRGQRVLDICTGSGIQGLVCAARGAARVVGLELSEEAVNVARFNVALNGFANTVEIRQSDLYSALEADEAFDFVVSNPPFMPVMDDVDYPICGTGGADGTRILQRIFEGLPQALAADGRGVLFCTALGDQYAIGFNNNCLARVAQTEGLLVRAFVNEKFRMSDYVNITLRDNLKFTCPELSSQERQEKTAAWQAELQRREVAADYLYSQIIRFSKCPEQKGVVNIPSYNPSITDPLVLRASMARARA